MTKSLQFWMSGVNAAPNINTLYRMEPKILKFYNIHWVRQLQGRISTIINEWCLQSPRVYNFEWVESTMLPASRLSTEFYNIDWVRGLQARIPTIMNEWCLPWSEVTSLNKWSQQWYQYKHSWRSEVTHILKSRILNEWSRQWSHHPDSLRNSIILTELADYRHEYLRLWMSDAFNDQKFTILNEWSQRCSQHPDSLPNGIL